MSRQGDYAVQYKLDGERVMLHFKRDGGADGSVPKVEWWTRNRKNATKGFGESMRSSLEECVPQSVSECIVDGEMMSVDLATGRFLAFGERLPGTTRNGGEGAEEGCGSRHVYVAFDLVFLNGRCLTGLELRERRALLASSFSFRDHAFELLPQTVIDKSCADGTRRVMEHLDSAMEKGHEGVVFKALSTTYEVGSRDRSWLKLKPDYVAGMGDTLDLLILAGYYGEGRRSGGQINSFLVGVRAPPEAAARMEGAVAGGKPLFYPLVKVRRSLW